MRYYSIASLSVYPESFLPAQWFHLFQQHGFSMNTARPQIMKPYFIFNGFPALRVTIQAIYHRNFSGRCN